jgi:hypothetical protein
MTLCEYRSVPPDEAFSPRTLDELNEILEAIYATEMTATTPAARAGFDLDCAMAEGAIQLASDGATVLVAQDEDGWYFAVDEEVGRLDDEGGSTHGSDCECMDCRSENRAIANSYEEAEVW